MREVRPSPPRLPARLAKATMVPSRETVGSPASRLAGSPPGPSERETSVRVPSASECIQTCVVSAAPPVSEKATADPSPDRAGR